MKSDYSQLREVNVRLVKMMMERESMPSRQELKDLLVGLPAAWLIEALESSKNIVGQDRDAVVNAIESELWARRVISALSEPTVERSARQRMIQEPVIHGPSYFKVAIVG